MSPAKTYRACGRQLMSPSAGHAYLADMKWNLGREEGDLPVNDPPPAEHPEEKAPIKEPPSREDGEKRRA